MSHGQEVRVFRNDIAYDIVAMSVSLEQFKTFWKNGSLFNQDIPLSHLYPANMEALFKQWDSVLEQTFQDQLVAKDVIHSGHAPALKAFHEYQSLLHSLPKNEEALQAPHAFAPFRNVLRSTESQLNLSEIACSVWVALTQTQSVSPESKQFFFEHMSESFSHGLSKLEDSKHLKVYKDIAQSHQLTMDEKKQYLDMLIKCDKRFLQDFDKPGYLMDGNPTSIQDFFSKALMFCEGDVLKTELYQWVVNYKPAQTTAAMLMKDSLRAMKDDPVAEGLGEMSPSMGRGS